MLAHGLADWTTLHIHLWYIHGLIHIMVVMLGLAFIGIRMRLFGRHRFRFALGALILACCARWVWPVLSAWDTGHWQLTDMALQRWLPSTNFATFLLGAMVGASLFKSKKWALMSIFVFALASAPIFGVFQSATFMTVGLLISYFREIPIPRILSRPIYIISGASLFIYLGHIYVYFTLRPQLLKILNFFHSDPQPVTSLSFKLTILAITVAACVSAWAAWNVLQTDAMRMYRKLSRGAPHR
jgi:hypothetical protein